MTRKCEYCGCESDNFNSTIHNFYNNVPIYLCKKHFALALGNERKYPQLNIVDNFYFNDPSWEYRSKPPFESLILTAHDLMGMYIAVRTWILCSPKYPRKDPIYNLMSILNVDAQREGHCHLGFLYIWWVAVAKECDLDLREYNFFNPSSAEDFDCMLMTETQNALGGFIHSLLSRLEV